jgi:hypothetical protein
VLFALVAIGVKLTGIVIALCLALLLIFQLLEEFTYKRLILLCSLPVMLYTILSAYGWLGGVSPTHGMSWGSEQTIFSQLSWRLSTTPEVTNLIYLGVFAALGFTVFQLRSNPEIRPVRFMLQLSAENGSRLIALIYTPLFGIGIIAMSFAGWLFLHRYAVPMIPFAIIQLALFAQVLKLQRELSLIFVALCLVSIYNHDGALYDATSAFSIVETSHAYEPYVLAQKTMIDDISRLEDEVPIFVTREIDYMSSHPMMGYLKAVKPNIIGIYKSRYTDLSLQDFPDDFYVAVNSRGHGGVRQKRILERARETEGWRVDHVYGQSIGGYNMYIKRVSKATVKSRAQ